jgi:hypothetical protein
MTKPASPADYAAEARRVEAILTNAARRVSSGDVAGAREMLKAEGLAQVAALADQPTDLLRVKESIRSLAETHEELGQMRQGINESKKTAKLTVDARPPPVRQSTETVSLTASDARMAEARRVEEILAQAARRVSSGDVIGARDMLAAAAAEDGAQGPVTFALAETYDPNMLVAWGSRGVTSDVVRARILYRKALEFGVTKANTRLEALK